MAELFEKVSSQMDFPGDEAKILAFWKAENIFHRSLAKNAGKPTVVFFEGPPTANGTPHNGHVLTRVIKDLFPRYKTMRGYHVPRKAGWDTHGLPVEVEVEKELGIHGKAAIEAYGVEDFTKKCIASVFRYTDAWEQLTERIGFWVDLSDAYVTYHESYVESVWWALAELFKKGLLYRGHKVVWWWPQGGTALSAAEVGLGYKSVDDPSVLVRFPITEHQGAAFLAWTTTPWTLPSNCALAVHPDVRYAFVEQGDETLIVAEPLIKSVFGDAPHTITKTVLGAELVGLHYASPFPYVTPENGKAWVVIPADFVTTDTGSGIVHIAPAFGTDDFNACKQHGVGFLQLVKPDGTFDARVAGPIGDFAGRFCKDADRDIIRNLKHRGLLFKEEVVRHDYPFCWRADSDPLIQYARPAWFIRTTEVTPAALANNQTINWIPEHIRDGRFGDWLKNNVDWALSRERYWGTPLPLWTCASCAKVDVFASVQEILARNPAAFDAFDKARAADPSLSPHLRVHKPWVDDVTVPCAACAGTMRRATEVIDCWFDSGCMPFAQWGWPHKGHAEFAQAFPADFISEAIDQTRGWFYSLLMISTLLFRDTTRAPHPFKTCIVLGHVTDTKGKKESKSKGNYTPPDKILNTDGADAMRWYFYASNPPWNNTRYSPEAVRLGQQEFLVKLRNVYSFFTIYANIDGFDPRPGSGSPRRPVSERPLLDRWMTTEFHQALRDVTAFMDDYKLYDAAQRIITLTDGLSNWYVRRSRDRFWSASDAGPDVVQAKWDAYHTLHETLVGITLMAAPFVPFIADTLWQNLVRRPNPDAPPSVHLAEWPAYDPAFIDESLSSDMQAVRELVAVGLQARNANRLKVRQPLARATFVPAVPELAARVRPYLAILEDELNVRECVIDTHRTIQRTHKPLFPAFKDATMPHTGAYQAALKALDSNALYAAMHQGAGTYALAATSPSGPLPELALTDALVYFEPVLDKSKKNLATAVAQIGLIELDTQLTPELVGAGRARDVLKLIQDWRKDANLAYTARIKVAIGGDPALVEACRVYAQFLAAESLAEAIGFDADAPDLVGAEVREADVDGLAIRLALAVR